jgi:plasmid stabilization system protein ParE
MKIRYERGALAGLDEIFEYIARDSRVAAARLVARFEEAAARIAENPYLGERRRANRDFDDFRSPTI